MQRGTIILIEDHDFLGGSIKEILEQRGFSVIWLKTFDEAFDYLDNFKISEMTSITAIIFDYTLDPRNKNIVSIPLVEIMRDMGYAGPMIANSTDSSFNNQLQKAGCTHITPEGEKSNVVNLIMQLACA